MGRKLQENQRNLNCSRRNLQKNLKANENQRKIMDEVEQQRKNFKTVKSMKTNKKTWARRRYKRLIKGKSDGNN